MRVTKSGKTLEEMIRKAINDHVITRAEYDEIMHLAQDDGAIDAHERVLLKELHSLLTEKVVRLVAK